MKTAVVILNWNTRDYLRKFVPGMVESCAGLDAEVIVADSGSTDGSIEVMKEEFPDIRLIELGGNYGFTGGYNRALAQIDAERFVLMNSDIEVAPDWLKVLDGWMDSHPECGVCGPKLLSYADRKMFEYAGAAGGYVDFMGYPYCRGRILKKVEEDKGQYDTPENVLWVSGACLMVRKSLWEKLGGLDDRFFAHMEEIDFCWRAQLEGFKVQVVPDSVVFHIGGGTLSNDSPWKLQLNYRNNLLMLENNLPRTTGRFRANVVIGVRLLMDDAASLVYLLTGKKDYFKSVREAHKGFRALRKGHRSQSSKSRIDGFGKGSIFVKYLFR